MPLNKNNLPQTTAHEVRLLRELGKGCRVASAKQTARKASARYMDRLERDWPPSRKREQVAGSKHVKAHAPRGEPAQGLRILVAEDNLLEADLVQRFLLHAGYEVIGPVARVGEALYLAQQQDIDGALLDINLAGVNSLAVARCLQERHVPFAFITGYPRSYIPGAGGLRSAPLLAKPLREDDVLNTVATFAA
jgi:CheY-like chemotaxis protein